MILTLLEATVRSAVFAVAVWAGLRAFRITNVLAQKAAWSLVLASAVLMPVLLPLTAHLPSLPAIPVPAHPFQTLASLLPHKAPQAASAPLAVRQSSEPATTTVLPVHPYVPTENLALSSVPEPTTRNTITTTPVADPIRSVPRISLPQAAWSAYLLIVTLLLSRMILGLITAFQVWRSSEPVEFAAEMSPAIPIRSSAKVASPVTLGSGVLLPASHTAWDPEKLRVVLAHECSHIRQGDFYLQLFAGIYTALFWFSPLGWWLKRKLSELAEAISDRAALEQAHSRSSYAQILLEFAAAPRPTLIGVAMARTSNLSHRIDRLLNDNAFRQSFAATRRRALFAALLVPITLVAVSGLVRVQAAQAPEPPTPPSGISAPAAPAVPPSPSVELAPVATPDPAANPMPVPAPTPSAIAAPAEPGSMAMAPAPPQAVPSPSAAPAVAPAPASPDADNDNDNDDETPAPRRPHRDHNSSRYSYSDNGESYAVIQGDGQKTFSGNMFNGHEQDFEKIRKQAHGDFLWFTRNGKSYYIDNPQVLSQIEGMYKPMEELGKQQEELGRQQEVFGKQQAELGEEIARQMKDFKVPAVDLKKEMAKLDEAMATLKAKQDKMFTEQDLAKLQASLAELQAHMGEMQGKWGMHQGEFGSKMGELGAKQGELGAKQGRLGAEQGRIAREADRKVKSIIDESLKNGSAKPVN